MSSKQKSKWYFLPWSSNHFTLQYQILYAKLTWGYLAQKIPINGLQLSLLQQFYYRYPPKQWNFSQFSYSRSVRQTTSQRPRKQLNGRLLKKFPVKLGYTTPVTALMMISFQPETPIATTICSVLFKRITIIIKNASVFDGKVGCGILWTSVF